MNEYKNSAESELPYAVIPLMAKVVQRITEIIMEDIFYAAHDKTFA